MIPIHPPSGTTAVNRTRGRRRTDLTLALPPRNASLSVPLPPIASVAGENTSSPTSDEINFSELKREKRIGSGTVGTVYKVSHGTSDRSSALKVFYGYHNAAVRHQMRREIQIVRDFNNPYLVDCHGISDQNNEIQLLLEYVDGGSLEGRRINHEPTLSRIASQILCGLFCLHRHKIFHGNIKPSNILSTAREKIKIADFGLSRIVAQTMDACYSSVVSIAYASPERININLDDENEYDGCADDIWCLGVTLIECYLGISPIINEFVNHEGERGDWAGFLHDLSLSKKLPKKLSVSREFRDFIASCLRFDQVNRSTAAELLGHPFITRTFSPPTRVHELQPLLPGFGELDGKPGYYNPDIVLRQLTTMIERFRIELGNVSTFILLADLVRRLEEMDTLQHDLKYYIKKYDRVKNSIRNKLWRFQKRVNIVGQKMIKRGVNEQVLKWRKWECVTLRIWTKLLFLAWRLYSWSTNWIEIFENELFTVSRELSNRDQILIENHKEYDAVNKYVRELHGGFNGMLIINRSNITSHQASSLQLQALTDLFEDVRIYESPIRSIHRAPIDHPRFLGLAEMGRERARERERKMGRNRARATDRARERAREAEGRHNRTRARSPDEGEGSSSKVRRVDQ